jgi:ubiquinone/menaquinone biosynthesis C-methylase UbiE
MKGKNRVGELWNRMFKEDSYKISLKDISRIGKSQHIKYILKYAKPHAEILEAGCGSAKFGFALSLRGFKVTVLDYSEHIIRNVAVLLEQLIQKYNIKLIPAKGDIARLNFKKNSFDIVFNEGVVEHWLGKKERIAIIKEMARVAKINGYVIIIVPNGRHPLYNFWLRHNYPYHNAPPMTLYDIKN